MRYQYWQAKNRVWCWHLKAADGQVVASGEGYVDKPDVLRAIDLARHARPADGDVGQSRRYRLSFAALLAVVAAAFCFWVVAQALLPRWDSSLVTVEADVLSTSSAGSGRHRSNYTKVRFTALDGRIVTTTLSNSSVQAGATTVRIQYDPLNPQAAFEDSNISPYILALTMLNGAAFFLWLAHASSLHDGQKHFM